MPEEDKIRWPLCYIACILKAFKLNEATHAVCGYCDALSTHAQETESGKEWECVLNIAIVFRCLYQAYYGSESPFSIVPCGIEPSVICRTIPAELKTQSSIRDFIAHSRASGPCLLLLVPSSSKFPDFDGFVVYCPDETTETIFGYQAKTSRTYPKNACPDWMEEGLLLRGNSPTVGSLRRGWKYMSQQDVLSLLGYSLCPMYPASWPAYPRTDEFDWLSLPLRTMGLGYASRSLLLASAQSCNDICCCMLCGVLYAVWCVVCWCVMCCSCLCDVLIFIGCIWTHIFDQSMESSGD